MSRLVLLSISDESSNKMSECSQEMLNHESQNNPWYRGEETLKHRGNAPQCENFHTYEPRHVISSILASVDSDEPVQRPIKLRNSKCSSVSS